MVDPSSRQLRSADSADRWFLVLAVAMQVAVAFGFGRQGFYAADDFLNAALAREMGLGWSFLDLPIFGHWTPGHRFADWLVTELAPLNWWLGLAVSAAFTVLALLCTQRLLLALDIDSWVGRVLVVVVAISPLLFRPVTWFAAGMHVLPGVAFVTMSLDGFCRYRLTRRWTHLAECALGFGLGLLFYEVPLLLVVFLPVLALVLMPTRLGIRAAWKDLSRLWPVAAVLGPMAIAYFIYYQTEVAYPLPHPTRQVLVEFLWAAWSRGFAASAVGLDAQSGSGLGRTPAVAIGQLAAVAVVAVTVVRRPVTWRAWALVAIVFVSNAFLVGWNRAAVFGAELGGDPRYHTVVLPFLVVALALGFGRPGRSVPWRRVVAVAAPTLLGLYVVAALISADQIAGRSEGVVVRSWVDGVRRDLASLHARGRTVSLFDTVVPARIVPPAFTPYDRVVHVVPLIDDRVVVDPTAVPRYVVTDEGRVRRARFAVEQRATLADAEGRSTDAPVCVGPSDPVRSITAATTQPVGRGRRFVRIRLEAGARTALRVYGHSPAGAFVLTDGAALMVPAGRGVTVGVDVADLRTVRIEVVDGFRACVTSVDVGGVEVMAPRSHDAR